MRSVWLVARQEYRRTVLRRSFILMTLGIPVLLVAASALGAYFVMASQSKKPVGYVDKAGILDLSLQSTLPRADKRVQIRAYPDEQAAEAALRVGEIQAFFVLPTGYPARLSTDVYYLDKAPSSEAWGQFDDFVRANLVAGYPEQVQKRLLEGPAVTVHDVASGREFGKAGVANIVLPFVATAFFFIATMMMSGYMLQVVADEKENRTVEVLYTSLTPGQLIAGKTLGLLAAALTQLGIYVLASIAALVVLAPSVPQIRALTVPWGYLAMAILFFLPAYALIGGMMVALGAAVTEVQQGQQVSGLLSIFFMLPIFLLPIILQNPSHPLVVFFSFFPTTSFLTIALRWGLGTVPLWQLASSWALLVATAAFTMWAAARIFRAGMLVYGQPLSLKMVMAAVRGH